MPRFLLGLDIGSSSVKASIVDADTLVTVATGQSPSEELPMIAVNPGWAEQEPELWWHHTTNAIRQCIQKVNGKGESILSIGISYQMHGLVIVDKNGKPLRPSIIWCDSRSVSIGDEANRELGEKYCLETFLNSPGNFTASKLKWVKDNEPEIFSRIHKFMLPGDYITLKLTGEIVTTDSSLSEGIFWDYQTSTTSKRLLDYFGFSSDLVPSLTPVFSQHGKIRSEVASELSINPKAIVGYTSGDQPNNAFSLNVVNAGETAATAGTSGVIYSVTDKKAFDKKSRVNTFVHVTNTPSKPTNGVLLCINGTGILNSWLRKITASSNYDEMNRHASGIAIGSDGITILPFGNGAERILENRSIGASFHGVDFNQHGQKHLFRAAQEGIVFSMRYGFDIFKEMGLRSSVIRAGHANMFLSPIFREAFVNTIGVPLELYNTDGATGAALGGGVGAGLFDVKDAFKGLKLMALEQPNTAKAEQYEKAYQIWNSKLKQYI